MGGVISLEARQHRKIDARRGGHGPLHASTQPSSVYDTRGLIVI